MREIRDLNEIYNINTNDVKEIILGTIKLMAVVSAAVIIGFTPFLIG